MTTPRAGHTATLLPNGLVLITGGCADLTCTTALNTAELYDPSTQTFTALTATMTTPRAFHTATLLPNGLVLLTGGYSGYGGPVSTALDSAELYDPSTRTFTALTATMTTPRALHTATLLPNGKVLITGGQQDNSGNTFLNTAELYDPSTQTFTALTATMTTARVGHAATLLPDGEVLITGGGHGSGLPLDSAELYDPATQTFTALTATMTTARGLHTSTLLPDGKVLITGGGSTPTGDFSSLVALNSAELYDPVADTFTALTATMTTARVGQTATLLPNGLVLLTGGATVSSGGTVNVLDTAEVYEALSPSADTFTALTAKMTTVRAFHTSTLLPNGKVLITGGLNNSSLSAAALDTAELYDPVANTFTAITGTMTTPRNQHTATLLPNGKVLIAGGSTSGNGDGLNSAELYDPATQTFTALSATMTTGRGGQTATLLPNGKVLIAGGFYNSPTSLDSAELYDPVTQTFTAILARMTTPRANQTATLLPNGKVLITGGDSGDGSPALDTAELYDPATQTFTALTATMTTARAGHTATLLPDGKVLITGGTDGFSTSGLTAFNSAELYDPATQTFTAITATMTTARAGHRATLLPNGLVLLTGGVGTFSGGNLNLLDTAELYHP